MKTSNTSINYYFISLESAQKSYKKHICKILIEHNLNITLDQFQVLEIIVNNKDIKYSKIASISSKDIASVNRIIDLLNSKGFISRQTDPNNRRRVMLAISNEGEKIHKKAGEIITQAGKEILNSFKEKRIEKQIKIFKKIIKKLK